MVQKEAQPRSLLVRVINDPFDHRPEAIPTGKLNRLVLNERTESQRKSAHAAISTPLAQQVPVFAKRNNEWLTEAMQWHRYSDGEWGRPPFVEVRLPECRTSGPSRNVDLSCRVVSFPQNSSRKWNLSTLQMQLLNTSPGLCLSLATRRTSWGKNSLVPTCTKFISTTSSNPTLTTGPVSRRCI